MWNIPVFRDLSVSKYWGKREWLIATRSHPIPTDRAWLRLVPATVAINFLASSIHAVQVVLILLMLRGTSVMQCVFPLFMTGGYAAAARSKGRFFLQGLLLALGIWWIWRRDRDRTGALAG